MMSLCFTMKTPLFNTVGCGKGTPPGYHLHGWFRTLQTLKPGDLIMMASVQIGHVESIALDPKGGGTVVRMEIERSVVVKADSTATINSAALPGRTCVVLAGGSPGATAALESAILKTRENRALRIRQGRAICPFTEWAERAALARFAWFAFKLRRQSAAVR